MLKQNDITKGHTRSAPKWCTPSELPSQEQLKLSRSRAQSSRSSGVSPPPYAGRPRPRQAQQTPDDFKDFEIKYFINNYPDETDRQSTGRPWHGRPRPPLGNPFPKKVRERGLGWQTGKSVWTSPSSHRTWGDQVGEVGVRTLKKDLVDRLVGITQGLLMDSVCVLTHRPSDPTLILNMGKSWAHPWVDEGRSRVGVYSHTQTV